MNGLVTIVGQGWTPGAIGIWVLIASVLAMWWKGLPSVLDAFERKQSGIELRTEALLDAQAKRFAEQLAAADERHDECMEGQRMLREEMRQRDEYYGSKIAALQGTIDAMRHGEVSIAAVVAHTIREAKSEGLNAPATLRRMAGKTGDKI